MAFLKALFRKEIEAIKRRLCRHEEWAYETLEEVNGALSKGTALVTKHTKTYSVCLKCGRRDWQHNGPMKYPEAIHNLYQKELEKWKQDK